MKYYIIPVFALFFTINVYAWQCPAIKGGVISDTKLYQGQQKFTVKFLQETLRQNSNSSIFFSPYSIYRALLLAYAGSSGSIETALLNNLYLNWSKDKSEVLTEFKHENAYHLENAKLETAFEFESADKFFFDKHVAIRDCMKTLFTDEIELLDIHNKPEDARLYINSWIEKVTRNHIKDFFAASSIDTTTNLAIVNAAYFMGRWKQAFKPDRTVKRNFYKTQNEPVSVEFMKQLEEFHFKTMYDVGIHVLDIPYNTTHPNGNDISFIAVLPVQQTDNALEDVLSKITFETFSQIVTRGSKIDVDIELPKFTFEQETELKPVLSNIGLGGLFADDADFSGFSETTKVLFSEASHKAKIEVDENGATATAATGLAFAISAPESFVANHPFFYMIYDHNTKMVLFAGVYKGPE